MRSYCLWLQKMALKLIAVIFGNTRCNTLIINSKYLFMQSSVRHIFGVPPKLVVCVWLLDYR